MQNESVSSFIVDAEIVAVDTMNGNILPFQHLQTRAKKDVKEEDVKIKACFIITIQKNE